MLIGCSPSSGGDLPTPGPKCSNDVEAAKLRSSLYAMAMIIPESIPVFAAQCWVISGIRKKLWIGNWQTLAAGCPGTWACGKPGFLNLKPCVNSKILGICLRN
jgi:hypothetical protein